MLSALDPSQANATLTEPAPLAVSRESLLIELRCQSSPKRCNHRLIFGMAALGALQDDSLFIVSTFHLAGDGAFNH